MRESTAPNLEQFVLVTGPSSRMCRLHGLMSKLASETVEADLEERPPPPPPNKREAREL